MRFARCVALSVGLAWIFWTFGANAQDATAAAIALYDSGVAALQRGDTATACPDFAESQRLVPQLGTLFLLAKCEDKAGKIASASTHYDQFLTDVRTLHPDKLAKFQSRVDEAEATRTSFVGEIPTLTLTLPANAPTNVEVVRDGTKLTAAMLSIAIPVDPGEHLVTTQVPGGPLHEQRFVIERKETKTVELEIELPPPPAPPPPLKPVVQVKPEQTDTRLGQGSSGLRTGGFVVLGVGLAGMVGFGVTGGLAMSKKSFVDETCPNKKCLEQAGMNAWTDAKTLANVTSVGMGVSVVAVLAGRSCWGRVRRVRRSAP
jgi:hypothetical protein